MARTGVQFLDIQKAALELQGYGKIPTVDGVREILGTGSKSTIAKYLRDWRTKQIEAGGDLPHELAALVTGLWRKLHTDADQRIQETEATSHQQIQILNQNIARLHQEQTELKKQIHHAEEIAETERSTKENLEKQLRDKEIEYIQSHEKSQALSQQLEAARTEITRLHQLTGNIQANLEHYQQEIHKQQLQQTLQVEKQLAFYIHEIASLKQHIDQQNLQFKPLAREKEQLEVALDQLKNQHQLLLAEHKTTQAQLQNIHAQKNRLLTENESLADVQNKLNDAVAHWREFEKKTAILSDQNARLQKDLSQAQEKVEHLREEKLFLIQEKAQLEGFLKAIK